MKTYLIGINVFKGEFMSGFILLRRYWFNLVAGTINMLLFLIFIQLGIRSFGAGVPAGLINGKIETLVIGFFSFSIIGVGLGSIPGRLSEGSSTGTLEQTMLSPIGIVWVLFFGVLTQFILSLAVYLILLPVSMLFCGRFFSVNIFQLVFFSVPLWLASCGVGLILGAISLVYKKTQNFSNLIQFLILTLMVLPSYPFNGFSLLPVSPQASILNKAIVWHQPIAAEWTLYLFLQSIAYLFLGSIVFKLAEKYAKKQGTLGQY